MSSSVWFCPIEQAQPPQAAARKSQALFDAAGFARIIAKGDRVAVKMHFGEGRNTNVVHPEIVRAVVDRIRGAGGSPFLTDSNTLYRGTRSNAVDHLETAYRHGYTPEAVGCPVIIADGMSGSDRALVDIDGKHFQRVSLASVAYFAQAAVVLTHVTGHCLTGYGGAIKNVAMGMASRAGKLAQHHNSHPTFDSKKCIACGECARWCPADAIEVDKHATLIVAKCIGCGECYTVCPADAVGFQWSEVGSNIQEKMVEHVLACQKSKPGKMAFLNYALHSTKDCDCLGDPQDKAFGDVGIFASTDPVAVDAATIAGINEALGYDAFQKLWPDIDHTVQLACGEKLGIGSRDYALHTL